MKSAESHSKITVTISNENEKPKFIDDSNADYADVYLYPINVEQRIFANDKSNNNIILKLEHPSPMGAILHSMFFHDLEVLGMDKNEVRVDMKYSFDGETLIIINDRFFDEIIIQYKFQSDFFLNSNPDVLYFFQPIIYNWCSWYFTNSQMQFDEIIFHIPDEEAYFFSTSTIKNNNGDYYTDISQIENNDISFYLLNKKYYVVDSFVNESIRVNLFFNKGVNVSIEPKIVNEEEKQLINIEVGNRNVDNLIKENKIFLNNALNKIIPFFEFSQPLEINIADSFLSLKDENDKSIYWGNTTKCNNDNYLLLIDTSFWNSHNQIHEIIHAINKNDPPKGDSTFYFFHESMTEYLAVYFSYDDKVKRDSIFNRKNENYKEYLSGLNSDISIFKVQSNETSLDGTNSGTSYIIYQKTPYKIYLLAKDIGQDKFLLLLSEFYLQAKNQQEYSFDQFEKLMRKEVNDSQWEAFINEL